MTGPRRVQMFEVSLKAFIVRGHRVLVLREADTGYWELPGGRIDAGEEWADHETVLAREIAEELGPAFHIAPTPEVATWTRQRPTDGVFQLIVARRCLHVAGEPVLSTEHSAVAWMSADEVAGLMLPPWSGYAAGLARLFKTAS